jgi:TatD DNase family protein
VVTWVDTHCHWDAPELSDHAAQRRTAARAQGVAMAVVPAVAVSNFAAVREWAHTHGDAYALGIHPLCVPDATPADLEVLEQALSDHRDDPRLVAVGEIGLDAWEPRLREPAMWDKQQAFYRAQLRLAKRFDLPVVLHVRKAVDAVLKGLRETAVGQGIAHAFNGSAQQAMAACELGLVLGFGGALTFDRAHQLRRLVSALPETAVVMETDGPDMPPHWLYVSQALRLKGQPQGVNASDELPRIGACAAQLRATSAQAWAQHTTANAYRALPKLGALAQAAFFL